MKPAAIWARVSSPDQQELSPDSQEAAVRAVLEAKGYTLASKHVIKVVWTSMDIMACPQFQLLRRWIANGEIEAVGVLDRDRLQAQGLQRLVFMSECQEHKVQVITAQGPPMMEGPEGQLVELALALGKEKSVLRAQQGAKDGLRDRAKLKGMPVNGKPPYGFKFRYESSGDKAIPVGLEPEPSTHFIAARIWAMAAAGRPLRGICGELIAEGIPAPKGGTWAAATLHNILHNPVYGGRYYALRHEAVLPQRRAKASYGKSSVRGIPSEDWHLLENFPISYPVVSWAEWEAVQERMRQNKVNSPRNANRLFMLSGMLFCEEDGRRLRGLTKKGGKYFYYACTLRKGATPGQPACSHKQIRGREIEDSVWISVKHFLSNPKTFMAEINGQRDNQSDGSAGAQAQLEQLQRKIKEVESWESELVGLRVRGQVSDAAFDRQSALLRAERTHYADEIERQEQALTTMKQSADALDSLEQLRDQIVGRLESATPEDRRWVLETLKTRVTVRKENIEVSVGIHAQKDGHIVSTTPGSGDTTPGSNLQRR